MKGLKTLIKIHRRTLDELRRKLMALETQKNALIMLSGQLAEELERELQLAYDHPEMANFFGDFAERIRKRQEVIRMEVRNLNKEIAKMNGMIAEEFSEMKKFEIALENRVQAQKEAEKRKETAILDEIGTQQYIRRHQDQS